MRLINTTTLALEEFPGHEDLHYAVLSHRWEPGEVSLQEYESGASQDKPGYQKIRRFCLLAAEDGYPYAWVDTCCIDKTSSAELSEAINSMFRWYSHSGACYAFLSDVQADEDMPMDRSVWFGRGWTLQELLAPAEVRFFDRNWTALGTKRELCGLINRVTNIDRVVLANGRFLHGVFSTAQIMSWAARRVTTRPEDRAYSLMGLFDVHMPLLYGEGGARAFQRLQEEIIRQSDDQSILAWTARGDDDGDEHLKDQQVKPWGLLADSPECFARCGQMVRMGISKSYAMTNRGLSVTLNMTPWAADTYLALLACCDHGVVPVEQRWGDYRMGVFLRKRDALDDRYERVAVDGKDYTHVSGVFRDQRPWYHVTTTVQMRYYMDNSDRLYGFHINTVALRGGDLDVLHVIDCDDWDPRRRVMKMATRSYGAAGTLVVPEDTSSQIAGIKLGFDFDFHPVIFLSELVPGSPDQTSAHAALALRDCFSYAGWSRVDSGHLSRNLSGKIWAIKGDRVTGLDVVINSVQSKLRVHIEILRDLSEDYKTWVVNIWEDDELEPPLRPGLIEDAFPIEI